MRFKKTIAGVALAIAALAALAPMTLRVQAAYYPNQSYFGVWCSSPALGGSLAACNTLAATLGGAMLVDRNFTLAGNTTLTAKVVEFQGGVITTAGFNLTLTGVIQAPAARLFNISGGGEIRPQQVSNVYAEWWGATNDGASSTAAFASMAVSLTYAGGGHVLLQNGIYSPGCPVFTTPVYVIGQGPNTTAGVGGTRVNASSVCAFKWLAGIVDTHGGGLQSVGIQSNNIAGGVVIVKNMWKFRYEDVYMYDGNGGASTTNVGLLIAGTSFESYVSGHFGNVCTKGCVVFEPDTTYVTTGPNSSMVVGSDFSPQNGGTAIYDDTVVDNIYAWNHFEFSGSNGGKFVRLLASQGTMLPNNTFGANTGASRNQISIEGAAKGIGITGNRITWATGNASGNAIIISTSARDIVIANNPFTVTSGGFTILNNGGDDVNVIGNPVEVLGAANGFLQVATGSAGGIISNNQVLGATSSIVATFVGFQIDDGALRQQVLGNQAAGLAKGFDMKQTGSSIVGSFALNWASSNTSNITIAAATALRLGANDGLVTYNTGTSAILNGQTTIVVSHGLGVTPLAAGITVIPTATTTNAPGLIYVDTITSTQFTVHSTADPGASTMAFSWSASAESL